MRALLTALLLLQPGPRAPLAPAETLLEPEILRAIEQQAPTPDGAESVAGSQPGHDILLWCADDRCGVALRAIRKLQALVAAKKLPQPARTIRATSSFEREATGRIASVLHIAESSEGPLRIVRGPWSTAGVSDEVAELFGKHFAPGIVIRPVEAIGMVGYGDYGIPTTTIVADRTVSNDRAEVIAAATAYFLATLPNAGSEALLSHLTVGAHARLAEDGRRAVAMMGGQQRASADVLIMFGQAIEREQRRMRSFESFMPSPVDPMLRSRIADMEKGITSVWTSMGITSSPFVPAAERIRGRGGEDRRVPSRVRPGRIPPIEAPTAFLTYSEVGEILYELTNFIDGKRSISDIRDAVSAEFRPLPISSVTDYFDRLARTGAITIK